MTNVPKNYFKLSEYLREKEQVLSAKQRLEIGAIMELDHAAELAKDPDTQARLAQAYADDGQKQRALAAWRKAAAGRADFYRDLYLFTADPDLAVTPEERRDFLERYIQAAKDDLKGTHDREAAYFNVIEIFFQEKKFEQCLSLIQRCFDDQEIATRQHRLDMVCRQGQCLEALGRPADAAERYRFYLEQRHYLGTQDVTRQWVQKRLSQLETKTEAPK
jgi:tetratricopeptide (TPR) repeat protein